MTQRWFGLCGALLAALLCACGSTSVTPTWGDGGPDAGPPDEGDAAPDAAADAASDAPGDAVACDPPRTACDVRCVDLTSDSSNCGACNRVCPGASHAAPSCNASTCALVCDPGWTDCDGNPSNGCEANLQTDSQNCGLCGRNCPGLPNAFPQCQGGTCGIGSCNPGYADCDMQAGDGCEADLVNDPRNCGGCGNVCPGGGACTNGSCATCAGGGTLCGGTCTNVTTDRNNCGFCGNVCSSAQTCTGGTCTCPSYSPNACGSTCTNLQTDSNNCGSCGHACGYPQTCNAGTCACYAGYSMCNGTCIYTQYDTNNCGACGNVCGTGQSCSAGKCVCASANQTFCGTGCFDLQNDPDNCGACGTKCPGTTASCVAGACAPTQVTLASNQSSPGAIALDKTYVYWVDSPSYGTTGSVMRVPKAGGGVTTLVQGEAQPYALALDASNVYFTDANSAVKKVPLIGGTSTVLASQAAYGLALSGATLYLGGGDLESMPTTGGSITLLATGQNQPHAIATDANNAYWITTGGVVRSIPLGGGTVTTLTSGQSGYSGIAVDATSVYFTNSSSGTIVSVPITGGGFTTLASGQSNPWNLAVAGGYVYWTNNTTGGSVMKVPVAGGTPIPVATGQAYPGGIAVDDTYVYWTTNSGQYYTATGAVMKTLR